MDTPAFNIPTALLLSRMDILAMLDVFILYAVRVKNNMLNCVHFEMMHEILVSTLKNTEIVGCDEPLKQCTKFTRELMTS